MTAPRRVAVFVRYWPTRSETFVAREVEGLRARGIAVDVVGLGRRPDGEGLPDGAIRPPRLPVAASPWLLRRSGREVARWLAAQVGRKAAARALALATIGAERGWERIHAHFVGEAAEWGLAVARLLDVPLSVTAHAVDLFVPRPAVPEVLRAARPAVTVCAHHARWIGERYGVAARVVRCGVPIDVPQAAPGGPLRVVSVARDVPKKNLDALVRAVRVAAPEAPVRLVSDAVRLRSAAVQVAPLAPEQVAAALAAHTLFVLPCRIAPGGDRDGVPVALLEAMAAGLPVISTAVAGIPEVVDDAVGWCVPPDDDAALIAAVREARDPAVRIARGRAGRARIVGEGWTVAGQVDALLAAWSGT